MQQSILLISLAVCLVCTVNGFRVPAPRIASVPRIISKLHSTEPEKYELVPVDKVNIENAASFTGGLLGLIMFGPIGAAVLAATVHYVSKKGNIARI